MFVKSLLEVHKQYKNEFMIYITKNLGILIKVTFWGTSTVTAVETQGFPGGTGRVRQYRFEISEECVTFHPILDDFGKN